jgi:hypothetical protein
VPVIGWLGLPAAAAAIKIVGMIGFALLLVFMGFA